MLYSVALLFRETPRTSAAHTSPYVRRLLPQPPVSFFTLPSSRLFCAPATLISFASLICQALACFRALHVPLSTPYSPTLPHPVSLPSPPIPAHVFLRNTSCGFQNKSGYLSYLLIAPCTLPPLYTPWYLSLTIKDTFLSQPTFTKSPE